MTEPEISPELFDEDFEEDFEDFDFDEEDLADIDDLLLEDESDDLDTSEEQA